MSVNHTPQIRTVGPNGQISIGKAFAGKMMLLEQVDEGTWLLKTGNFIPDSEKWIYEPEHLARLEKSLKWAAENEPRDNFAELAKKFLDEKN